MPRIQRIDVPQLVRIRKYEVDHKRLQNLLREQKKRVSKSNKSLAEALCVPVTKVEHWFRTDSCFAIPDADLWEQIKAELEISTSEFDESITTFEERPGVYEKSERCYLATGIAPTLTSASARNEKIIVKGDEMEGIRKLTPKECFRLMGFDDADFAKAEAVNSNAQLYKQAGNSIVVPVVQGIIQGLLDCGALATEGIEAT